MVSTVILTKDEADDLPGCLKSLAWCDDVHVVDSGSKDDTVQIARKAGATVWNHAFDSFGCQRNWALDTCALQHPWILFLDADERSTPRFVDGLYYAVRSCSADIAGYFCCWKLMMEGRWLRRCDAFPRWQFRVVRKGHARFCDFGHGQKEADVIGRIGYIAEPYLHFAFSKGWSHWFDRHNHYSTREATARLAASYSWRDVRRAKGMHRAAVYKTLLARYRAWPLARFLYSYLWKLGCFEGRPGWIYCVNMAYYEFMIQLKMQELSSVAKETNDQEAAKQRAGG
jgi:glycosyltransferase involved in cell wall biosynthesis